MDVKASVLLGSKGYDLQKATQRLESLQGRRAIVSDPSTVPDADLDIQTFLKKERETAIMSVIEEVKRSTIERIDELYWENLEREWQQKKQGIMTDLSGIKAGQTSTSAGGLSSSSFMGDSSFLHQRDTSTATFIPNKKNILDNIMEMIRKGENYEPVVGSISTDGCRVQGSLGRMLQQQSSSSSSSSVPSWDEVITSLAEECERQAFLLDAVKLFDLAGDHTRALEVLNKLLAPVVSEKPSVQDSSRAGLQDLALRLAERYARHGTSAKKTVLATFHLLLDLMTFFSYYHKQSLYDALDTIEKLNLIPLDVSSIDLKVQDFKHLPQEIQRSIPEILLACMNILYAQFRESKAATGSSVSKFGMSPDHGSRESRLSDIRSKAKSLITYAGMIPYRMPTETNAKLVHLEVIMN